MALLGGTPVSGEYSSGPVLVIRSSWIAGESDWAGARAYARPERRARRWPTPSRLPMHDTLPVGHLPPVGAASEPRRAALRLPLPPSRSHGILRLIEMSRQDRSYARYPLVR